MTIQATSNVFLYPASTRDYAITASSEKCGGKGLGLVARRDIRKGKMIFDNSLEYTFTNVAQEGDYVLFNHHEEASKQTGSEVPSTFPLTPDVLNRTHGVPYLDNDTKTTESWHLEVPGMFMNHSCDPNVKAYPRSSDEAEDYAAKDINKGEELTVDYCLQYYDHGPFFEKCTCGATNCRGSMMGFVSLSDAEKERLFPFASEFVQAMHLAASGHGPPVKRSLVGTSLPRAPPIGPIVPRLVFPGPSHALADVVLQKDSKTGQFGLYSLKDVKAGTYIYEYWNQAWPDNMPSEIDVVFAAPLSASSDPPEGTVIRIDATKHALRDRTNRFLFSGWAMLTNHSCNPNVVYGNASKHKEDWEWQRAYAVKDIKAGEQLTIDFNCMLWDRSTVALHDECKCGSDTCSGTMKGFKFLAQNAQEKRMNNSWGSVSALSAHVRENLRKVHIEAVMNTDESTRELSVGSEDESSDSGSDEE